MKSSKEQEIFGASIDNKLTFKSYIKNLCKKVTKNRSFAKALKSSK